ncbi:MAG: metallophosphoesterase [Pseudomonadota bacterium]|nr:metallophosphoesterase [Pseudomonadota bacterium]
MTQYRFRGKYNHRHRRLSEIVLGALLAGGHAARLSTRLGLHGRLGVTRHEVMLPAGRALARPLRIAFASDFHAGPTTDPALFARLFEQIALEQPDVLLLGGDFVSGEARNVAVLAEGLARCDPPLGKFAVLGNHDLWTDERVVRDLLEAAGTQVLVNRSVTLAAPFASVSLCGMDDPWTGQPDGALTFDGAAATRILMIHSPDGLLRTEGNAFDLALAGHTHGGQVALPGGTPIMVPAGPLCRQFNYGRFQIADNGVLVVSRGVGCSTIPVRINAHPELVICTLVAWAA